MRQYRDSISGASSLMVDPVEGSSNSSANSRRLLSFSADWQQPGSADGSASGTLAAETGSSSSQQRPAAGAHIHPFPSILRYMGTSSELNAPLTAQFVEWTGVFAIRI
jgi:hypothetical protein